MTQPKQLPSITDDLVGKGLDGLAAEIERARYLLDLPDDWDTDGSPGFAEATWTRTVNLAVDLGTSLADGWSLTPRDIEILPGAGGNLSLEVAYPNATILFSVPKDRDAPVRYYGRNDAGGRTTKGLLAPEESLDWLSLWTAKA